MSVTSTPTTRVARPARRSPSASPASAAAAPDREEDRRRLGQRAARAPARRARAPPRRSRGCRSAPEPPVGTRYGRSPRSAAAHEHARAVAAPRPARCARRPPRRRTPRRGAATRAPRAVTGWSTSTSVVAMPHARARIVVARPWCVPMPPVVTTRRAPPRHGLARARTRACAACCRRRAARSARRASPRGRGEPGERQAARPASGRARKAPVGDASREGRKAPEQGGLGHGRFDSHASRREPAIRAD